MYSTNPQHRAEPNGLEWWQAKPKQMRKATKQARALLRAAA